MRVEVLTGTAVSVAVTVWVAVGVEDWIGILVEVDIGVPDGVAEDGLVWVLVGVM